MIEFPAKVLVLGPGGDLHPIEMTKLFSATRLLCCRDLNTWRCALRCAVAGLEFCFVGLFVYPVWVSFGPVWALYYVYCLIKYFQMKKKM